jgi:hypothetical protein
MNIEKNTYGKTPAAVYLSSYLSKLDKPLITKRTGKILTGFRSTFSQLEKANLDGILSAHNLARVISSMREKFHVNLEEELVSNLVTNIIVGEMKILLRKSSEIRKIEMQQKRVFGNSKKLPSGEIFNRKGYKVAELSLDNVTLPSYTIAEVKDEINADTLTEKWKIKMSRRNIQINP